MSTVRASELKFRQISSIFGGAGAVTIVSGVAGCRLKIVGLVVSSSAGVSITVQDTDATDLIGAMPVAANGVIPFAFAEGGWQITEVGKGIQLRISGAGTLGGVLVYQEVP